MNLFWEKTLVIILCALAVNVVWTRCAKAGDKQITIVVVGDSTACNYSASQAPRTGWAQVLNQFFADTVTVKNHAASGRSSKSFIAEGRLTTALKDLGQGDYLFIQFGHNDEKSNDASRYTVASTTFKDMLTQYIEAARDKGAYPVLLTPLERRGFNSTGTVKTSHQNYPKAMTELGAELNVPVIDVTEKSQALFYDLGPEGTKNIFLWLEPGVSPNFPDGIQDNTHLQKAGAIEICKLVIEGLNELDLPLCDHLK